MRQHASAVIPDFMKPALKRLYYVPSDIVYRLTQRGSMIPPKSMIFTGDGDFEATGREFRDYFVELGGLLPDHRVLDVGSGIGRMAVPLTEYLSAAGSYEGFDIVEMGVRWCQERITPRFGNFRFAQSDVLNQNYHPMGKVRAAEYRFTYADDEFDFVFLTSVFTHMLPPDLENYLSEITRVMKPGGRCLITFFLLNEESRASVAAGTTSQNFSHPLDGCVTTRVTCPESAVAYEEGTVRQMFAERGLTIDEPIHYGSWCQRANSVSYQDMVVATKPTQG